MRVKMPSSSANTMTTLYWGNRALHRSLHTFARDANDAAIALYAITQVCSPIFGSSRIQRDVAHKFLRVAGVVSSLLATRDVEALPDVAKAQLNAHVERCQPLLRNVNAVVEKLHAHYSVTQQRAERVSWTSGAFGRQEEKEITDVLDRFFEVALRVRFGVIMIESGSSNACICHQTQQPHFNNLECLLQKVDKSLLAQPFFLFGPSPPSENQQVRSGLFAGIQQGGLFGNFSQNRDETRQHSQPSIRPQVIPTLFTNNDAEAVQSERDLATSSAVKKNPFAEFHGLAQPGQIPHGNSRADVDGREEKHPFATYCDVSPSRSACQPQIWGTSGGKAGSESMSALAPPAPVQQHYFPMSRGRVPQSLPFPHPQPQPAKSSHCHQQPAPTPTEDMFDTRPLFGGNIPVANPPFGGNAPANYFSFGAKSAATTVGIFEHLEAYILRPHADLSVNSTTWSYKTELLLLDNDAMQAHNTKLGPTYSVVDSIALLQSQQLHLVQEHVKSRQGMLMSVQFGAGADMPTPMGLTVRIRSVIFLLKTVTAMEKEKDVPQPGVQYSCWGGNATRPGGLFGNATYATNTNTGLFGAQNLAPKPSLFGTSNWQQAANSGGGLFGASTGNPALSKGDHLCTFRLRDDNSGAMQQYMALPAYFKEAGKSFEEVRVEENKIGCTQDTAAAGSLFGMTKVKNDFQSMSLGASAATTNNASTSTPLFGGWGQKAAIHENPAAFGLTKSPFAASLNDANGPTPSVFKNMASNPFAASTTPTKAPPNPFPLISLSQQATAVGFSPAPVVPSGDSSLQFRPSSPAPTLFGTPAPTTSISKPSLFGASTSQPTLPFGASKPTTSSIFGTTPFPKSTSSQFESSTVSSDHRLSTLFPPPSTNLVVPPPTSTFTVPNAEMTQSIIGAHEAFRDAAAPAEEGLAQEVEDEQAGEVKKIEEGGVDEQEKGEEQDRKKNGGGEQEKTEEGDRKEEVVGGEEKYDDGEYVDCGDVDEREVQSLI